MQETQVQSLGQEDPLEKEMATHPSILVWEILWTQEPGGLQSMWLQKSCTWLGDEATAAQVEATSSAAQWLEWNLTSDVALLLKPCLVEMSFVHSSSLFFFFLKAVSSVSFTLYLWIQISDHPYCPLSPTHLNNAVSSLPGAPLNLEVKCEGKLNQDGLHL